MELFDRSDMEAALKKARPEQRPASHRNRSQQRRQKQLSYIEETSMMIFRMYVEDLEQEREAAARRSGDSYTPMVEQYRWETWTAAGLNKPGSLSLS